MPRRCLDIGLGVGRLDSGKVVVHLRRLLAGGNRYELAGLRPEPVPVPCATGHVQESAGAGDGLIGPDPKSDVAFEDEEGLIARVLVQKSRYRRGCKGRTYLGDTPIDDMAILNGPACLSTR